MSRLCGIITILLQGVLISAPFLSVFVIGYFNKAPSIFGILFWFVVVILGFPWNIPIALLASQFEQTYAPGLFQQLNENHDRTVGYFMFIGYVSVLINGIIVAALLKRRKMRNQQNAGDINA